MSDDKKEFILKDGSILPWERPIRAGYMSNLFLYNGSTKIIGYLGFDNLDENIGQFKIIGSASKYLVDIVHLNRENPFKSSGDKIGEKKQEILFSGGIIVYRQGQIPGTEIEGYDFEKNGKIWVTKEPLERYKSKDGLKNLIFENSQDYGGRIEEIISYYQNEEDEAERANGRMQNHYWDLGHMSGRREGPGWGRGGPC